MKLPVKQLAAETYHPGAKPLPLMVTNKFVSPRGAFCII